MGGSKDKTAGSSRHGVTGPTDKEPYALDWADYPASVLRAFAKFFPDAEGFDASAEELTEMTHSQLVGKCEEIQVKCSKAIDRPWAMELMELFAQSEGNVPAELEGLTFNELDRVRRSPRKLGKAAAVLEEESEKDKELKLLRAQVKRLSDIVDEQQGKAAKEKGKSRSHSVPPKAASTKAVMA